MPHPIGRTQTGAYANVERGNQRGIKEVERLKAENARLRTALEEIAALSPTSFYRCDDPSFVIEVAQDALKEAAERKETT